MVGLQLFGFGVKHQGMASVVEFIAFVRVVAAPAEGKSAGIDPSVFVVGDSKR